jgi:hypothetical protein
MTVPVRDEDLAWGKLVRGGNRPQVSHLQEVVVPHRHGLFPCLPVETIESRYAQMARLQVRKLMT